MTRRPFTGDAVPVPIEPVDVIIGMTESPAGLIPQSLRRSDAHVARIERRLDLAAAPSP